MFKQRIILISFLFSVCATWAAHASAIDLIIKVDKRTSQSQAVDNPQHDRRLSQRITRLVILAERMVAMAVLNLVDRGLMQLDSQLEVMEGWLSIKLYQASLDNRRSQPC